MYNEKIDRLIDGWRDELIETLRRWIAIDSQADESAPAPNAPFGPAVRGMLDAALADAQKLGFETEDAEGYAGVVKLGAGEQTMGILAHLDIVPAGEGWTHAPFGGEIADGKLYGRGTADDKGPAVAALFAMRAVREAGVALRDGVQLILGCDEENGMGDMKYYREHRKVPDYSFSPDAEFPLINIEKGGLHVVLSAQGGDEASARIPVYSLHAGERVNVVPGTATAEVGTSTVSAAEMNALLAEKGLKVRATDLGDGRARLEATGVGAHASMPHLGVNAAGLLLIALRELNAGGGSAQAIAALADKLGLEGDGKSLNIAMSDEKSGALTCNLGLLRYDGQVLRAHLDIRYPLCAAEPDLCGRMVMALTGTPLSVSREGGHPVHYVPEDHRLVRGLLEVYHDLTGLPAKAIAIGGGTYSQTMPNTVAFGINFPGDADPCHMPDEFVDIDKLLLSTKIMAHAIEKLAGR